MDIKPTLYHCKCGRCGTEFDLCSAIGRSDICDVCAAKLRAFIFAKEDDE